MLRDRLLVALVLVPLAAVSVGLGDWFYTAIITILIGICAWEYWRMMRDGGFFTSLWLFIGVVAAMIILRYAFDLSGTALAASFGILAFMAYHTFRFQEGENGSATHFTMAVGGLFYLGWLGSYLIALRQLPDGDLWVFTGLTAAWWADAGAYFVGIRFGKHKMMPRVSPKKSWEGYIAGIFTAAIFNGLMAWAWSLRAPQITPWHGVILGVVIGALTPLGDLGESMLKRQFGIKDTSKLLPGHGGMLDRMDSSLWAGVLSYYIITLFML